MTPLQPVQSSMLAAVGFDPATRTLAVRFNNSDLIHHYKDVPAETAEALTSAESIGKAFNSLVRGKFESTSFNVDDEDAITTKAGVTIDTRKPWALPVETQS